MVTVTPITPQEAEVLKKEFNKLREGCDDFCTSYCWESGDERELRVEGSKGNLIRFSTVKEWADMDYCEGNYGYKNEKGEVIIPPQYLSAGIFSSSLAAVCMKNAQTNREEWFYIDEEGKQKFEGTYPWVTDFNRYGVAGVWDGEKCYLIDEEGSRLPDAVFDDISCGHTYRNRYIPVEIRAPQGQATDRFLYGCYDSKKKKMVGSVEYEWFEPFSMYLEWYRMIPWNREQQPELNEYGAKMISEGKTVWEAHSITAPFDDGCQIVGNGYGILILDHPEIDYNGLVIKRGIQNPKGKLLIPMEYQEIFYIGNGVYLGEKENSYDKIIITAEDSTMKTVKITAMRKSEYPDLMKQYENPINHTCDVLVGQEFISVDGQKPEGLCQSAWESMEYFVRELAKGSGNFYDGWMKNPASAMISCNDGFRPVSFYIEVIEE